MSFQSTSELIELIYQASAEPAVWPQISEKINVLLRGSSVFFIHDLHSSAITLLARQDVDMAAIRSYEQHYAGRNPIIPRALQRPDGTANPIESLMERRDFDRAEYYADWFRPNGFHHSTGVSMRVDDNSSVFLTFFRPKRDGEYSDSAHRILETLAPHFRQSVTMGRRLEELSASAAIGYVALHKLGTAAFTVTRRGGVTELNEAAQSLLDDGSELRIVAGRLRCVIENHIPLAHHIQHVIDTRQAKTFSLPSARGGEPLQVMLLPPIQARIWAPEPTVLMMVRTPRAVLASALDQIRNAYGLTHAETRLVAGLAGGETVNQFCERAGVSRNTVKTQLSSLFSKTGTSQQKELVRLVFTQIPPQR